MVKEKLNFDIFNNLARKDLVHLMRIIGKKIIRTRSLKFPLFLIILLDLKAKIL